MRRSPEGSANPFPKGHVMDDASQNGADNKLPFNLAKFFSYISLVLILISSVILTLFIGRTMNSSVLESQQEYALLLADNINRQIFRKFTLPVTYASGRVALSNPAQYKLLDEVITIIIPFSILQTRAKCAAPTCTPQASLWYSKASPIISTSFLPSPTRRHW